MKCSIVCWELPFSKTSYHIENRQLIWKVNLSPYVWCILSFKHGRNKFYSPKTVSLKIEKKGIIFFKLRLFIYVKNWETFHHFFSLHPQKYFTKAFYCLLQKYLVKSFYYLLPIIMTYHTQKYFIKALYCLPKTWLCVT